MKEGRIFDGIVIIETIGVKLCDGGGGNHDAFGKSVFEDVERKEESLVKGWSEAIIWWGGEAEEVDFLGRLSAHEASRFM